MALKSGNNPIPEWTALDANHAIIILSFIHHWRATVKQTKDRRGIEVTLCHGGYRVTASSRTFVSAVNAALTKLKSKLEPPLRLVTG